MSDEQGLDEAYEHADADLYDADPHEAADAADAVPAITGAELAAWVTELLPLIESQSSYENARWCPRWFEHREAVMRFDALYAAELQAQADGEMSSWWVNHWDRHAPALFGHRGIFEACHREGHDPNRRFLFANVETPPADWEL